MGQSTAITIATMNAMNSANNYHHHYNSDDAGTQLIALALTCVAIASLWIAFTSIRQLIRKDEDYDFVEDNIVALITIGVIAGLVLFFGLFLIIYTLIK